MKTRIKIIIVGIVLTTIVFGTHQSLMYQCGTLPIFMQTPRSPNLWNCLEIWSESDFVPVNESIKLQIWCAKKFDESLSSWGKSLLDSYLGDLQLSLEPLPKRFLLMEHEHFAEWRENGCVGIIHDWAYLSENEDYIWNSGIDWKLET